MNTLSGFSTEGRAPLARCYTVLKARRDEEPDLPIHAGTLTPLQEAVPGRRLDRRAAWAL